jgi:hypothetical protein
MTLQKVSPAQQRVQLPHSAEVFTSGDMKTIAPASLSTLAPGFRLTARIWQSVPKALFYFEKLNAIQFHSQLDKQIGIDDFDVDVCVQQYY